MEVDHRPGYALGRTRLDELDPLCSHIPLRQPSDESDADASDPILRHAETERTDSHLNTGGASCTEVGMQQFEPSLRRSGHPRVVEQRRHGLVDPVGRGGEHEPIHVGCVLVDQTVGAVGDLEAVAILCAGNQKRSGPSNAGGDAATLLWVQVRQW